MALTVSQTASSGDVAVSSQAFSVNVANGSLIEVALRYNNTTDAASGLSDGLSTTYTLRKRQASSLEAVEIWTGQTTSAGACTVTITFSAGTAARMRLGEIAGWVGTPTFDVSGGATGSSANPSSGSVTAGGNGWGIGAFCGDSYPAVNPTPNTGWTLEAADVNKCWLTDRAVTSGAGYSADLTLSGSDVWAAAIVLIKDAGGDTLFAQAVF